MFELCRDVATSRRNTVQAMYRVATEWEQHGKLRSAVTLKHQETASQRDATMKTNKGDFYKLPRRVFFSITPHFQCGDYQANISRRVEGTRSQNRINRTHLNRIHLYRTHRNVLFHDVVWFGIESELFLLPSFVYSRCVGYVCGWIRKTTVAICGGGSESPGLFVGVPFEWVLSLEDKKKDAFWGHPFELVRWGDG